MYIHTFVNPPSHAERWIAEAFPYRARLIREIQSELGPPSGLDPDLPDKAFFGRVVENALNLTLTEHPPRLRQLGCLPPVVARRILTLVDYRAPVGAPAAPLRHRQRLPRQPHPARLYTAACQLAQVDIRLREFGIRRPNVLDITRKHFIRHPDDLNHPASADTLPAFERLWATHSCGFHDGLQSYGRPTVQLPLLGGRRHADYLLGTTVLELKTGPTNQTRYVNELIVQLLVYTLLAIHDGRPVTHVAVYATRHQRLLRYAVAPLLHELHGHPVDPVAVGATLAAQIIADQPEPARSERNDHESTEHRDLVGL